MEIPYCHISPLTVKYNKLLRNKCYELKIKVKFLVLVGSFFCTKVRTFFFEMDLRIIFYISLIEKRGQMSD